MTEKQNEYQSHAVIPPSNPSYPPVTPSTPIEPQVPVLPNATYSYGSPYAHVPHTSAIEDSQPPHYQDFQEEPISENAPLVCPPPYEESGPTHVYLTTSPGYKPQCLFCPTCAKNVISETTHTAGNFAWASSFVLCFFGWWVCAPLPLVLNSCNDVKHTCPVCKTIIAERHRMS